MTGNKLVASYPAPTYLRAVMPVSTPSSLASDVNAYELFTADLAGGGSGEGLFLHTASASLQIDATGICRAVFTLDGSEPLDLERCVGAQYVASVADDGISGTPIVGASALLVDRTTAGPPAVIKTAAITAVVYAGDLLDA